MEVPLPIDTSPNVAPCGATENGAPVVRRSFASWAPTRFKVETLARRRSGFCSHGFFEPSVLIRAVVRHNVHEDFQPQGMCLLKETVELAEGSVHRVDIAVVGDVVSVVALGGNGKWG